MKDKAEQSQTGSDSSADHDEQVAGLLEQLIAESRNGRLPDWQALGARHPNIIDELRELWATAMIAEGFGSSMASNGSAVLAANSNLTGDRDSRSELSTGADREAWPIRVGDYELLEEIGRGGMGVVFKARQISLGRTVALKMILRGELASEADLARFRAEAESAARLSHPHIVPVYEVGQHDRQPYFSMKLVEGTTLAKRLIDGPLPPREAAGLLLPVCRAIAEAHRHGVLHRDLKPSNILIDRGGSPHVSDFGLAKRFEQAPVDPDRRDATAVTMARSGSGAIVGTPGYMAPEQAAGRRGEVSPATDVYSLGGLLYAMLTGRPPFQAASPIDTLLAVLEQEPVPPRLLNRQADSELEMICLKCLQKPADIRYQTADQLADDLQAYLADEPISARSSQFSQVISRAFRETHHAPVLENWGLLWMLHSLVLLVLCLTTNGMQWLHVTSRWPYLGLWVVGLGIWTAVFWNLRHRSGPITFVERQIAHVWAGSMICNTLLYGVEALLNLPVLTLSPVLGLVSGMVFLIKAAILSGTFYVQAGLLFLTGLVMALIPALGLPPVGLSLFGIVSAGCFFFPGWKYYRLRVNSVQ